MTDNDEERFWHVFREELTNATKDISDCLEPCPGGRANPAERLGGNSGGQAIGVNGRRRPPYAAAQKQLPPASRPALMPADTPQRRPERAITVVFVCSRASVFSMRTSSFAHGRLRVIFLAIVVPHAPCRQPNSTHHNANHPAGAS
jgi:hypothetical protein